MSETLSALDAVSLTGSLARSKWLRPSRLQSASEQRFSHLVELRPGNAGRPLFIVHGVFGDVLQLKGLAEQMETSRPIYALQARGADPRQEPHSTITEMVEAYLEAIRGVQVAGPYALAGYSFGGLIAFEMARRLRERGEEVELLALLETDLHERYLPLPRWLAYQWSLVLRVTGKAVTLPAKTLPAYLASKLVQLCNKLRTRANLRDPAGELEGTVWALSERHRRMFQIGVRAIVSFRPGRYDRTASIFRVTGPRFGACDPLPIWRRAVRSVEVYAIAGEHDTIMEEPFVRTLALEFSRCLAAAERTAVPLPAVERLSKPRREQSSSPLVLLPDDDLEALRHGGES
jgi:acetoacetyl-CoA synthetase